QTVALQAGLQGALIATQMSASLTDESDEQSTLWVVKWALETASESLVLARSQINDVLGRCRHSQFVYDMAKTLMGIVQEAATVVQPIFKRVEAASAKQ